LRKAEGRTSANKKGKAEVTLGEGGSKLDIEEDSFKEGILSLYPFQAWRKKKTAGL